MEAGDAKVPVVDELRASGGSKNLRNDLKERLIFDLAGGSETSLLVVQRRVQMAGMAAKLVGAGGWESVEGPTQDFGRQCTGSGNSYSSDGDECFLLDFQRD